MNSDDSTPRGSVGQTSGGDTPPDSVEVTEVLGKYLELEEFARGGMGRILLVRDRNLNRDIALKTLYLSSADDASTWNMETRSMLNKAAEARFLREARLTGRLEHPSIVPVYDLGRRDDGSLFYTMKLIRGRTFKQALEETDSFSKRMALLPHYVDLCHALAYAHSRGVIHRDIKPSNVLIGEFGETVVIDWGLAKDTRQAENVEAAGAPYSDPLAPADPETLLLTQHGQLLGTPHYASPEQALGNVEEISQASDVYALGAVLYQLLTGVTPYHGDSVQGVIDQVISGQIAPVRQLAPEAPAELVAICERSMQREAADRYVSARELVDDLRRFQTGAVVQAYQYTISDRLRRFVHRYRTVLSSAAISLVILIAMGIAALLQVLQEKRHTEEALYGASINVATQAIADKRFHEARLALADAPAWRRDWEWGLLTYLSHPNMITYAGHQNTVNGVDASTDGEYVATASADGTARIWRAKTGEELRVLRGHTGSVSSVRYSPDGRYLATGGADGTVRLWEPGTGMALMTIETHTNGKASFIAIGPNGKTIAVGSQDFSAGLWDAASGRRLVAFIGHTERLSWIAINHHGSMVATSSLDLTTRLWDCATGQCVRVLEGYEKSVVAVAFSPDDTALAAVSVDGSVKLWDIAAGNLRQEYSGHTASVCGVAFTPDGSRLVTSSEDRTVRVWDIQSGKQLHIIEGFASPLHFLTVSPDGARALIRDEYSMAVSVSLAPTDALTHLRGHSGTVNAVAFSPDGARLVTGAGNWNAEDDARAMVWDVKTGRLVRTLTGHASSVNCVAYYPDGKRVATGSRDQSAIVWDVDSARPLLTLAGHGGQVRSLALSRDGKRLVTGSWDHTAMLWDAETGERLAVLEGCEDVLDSVAFAPSGREVLTGSRDGKVRYWDVDTARVTKTLSLGLGWVWCLAFSPDGAYLAVGGSANSDGRTAMICDATSGEVRTVLLGHASRVASLAWAPDGRRIVTGGIDATVRVWDPVTGRELLRLTEHSDRVKAAAFSPDGRYLATGSYDKTAILWPSDPWR